MKKLLLLVFIVISTFSANAQFSVYHPFPDSNAYWKEFSSGSYGVGITCNGYGYNLSGDTIVNGIIHHKLYSVGGVYANNCIGTGTVTHSRSFYGAIRQDSMKREYICCTTYIKGDSLLYDFNLNIGDTLKQFNTAGVAWKCYIDAIDSILIDGSYRKQFIIASDYNQPHQIADSIIEGIGSLQGLIETIQPVHASEFVSRLDCFRQNGYIVMGGGQNEFNDSCTVYGPLSINEIENPVRSFAIYPNPANTSLTLSYQLNCNNAVLRLYNTMGQLLKSRTIGNNNGAVEDNVSDLPGGIYYYTLSVDGLVEATNKLAIIR